MIIIIGSWLIYFLIIFQVGRLLLRNKFLSIFHFERKIEWYEYFWIGLVGTVAILQIWSIFLPVNETCLLFVGGISLITLIFSLRGRKFPTLEQIKKFVAANRAFIVVSIIGLLGLAYYASQPVSYFDTLLYHLNSVKWGNTFTVVPGLANLHARLGFNSSFFLLASMVDNFFLRNASVHVVLPLLISVLSMEIVWIYFKSDNLLVKIFVLTVSPFIIRGVLHEGIASSFSPDFVLALLVLAVSIEILSDTRKSLFIAGVISVLALTIKLSGVVFFAILFSFILFELIRRLKKERVKALLIMLFSGGILFVPYLVRNIILSGWIFYPAPILKIGLPWSLPDKNVVGMFNVIHAWAIAPGSNWINYVNVGFAEWFPYWFKNNSNAIEIKMFVIGCFLFVVLITLGIYRKKLLRNIKPIVILILAGLFNAVYVLITAPDFRFGSIFVWVFFAAALIPFIIFIINKVKPPIVFWSIAWITFLFITSWPIAVRGVLLLGSVLKEPPYPTKIILVNPSNLVNEFKILRPIKDDLCGNSDLPCTPESNKIREISPGDISKGFVPVE